MNILKSVFKNIIRKKLKQEFDNQSFNRFNERPVEYAFALKMLSRFYPRTLLDVGSGTTAFPHILKNCGMIVTGIDNIKDYWSNGMFNRHFYIVDDDILKPKKISKYDMIFCISTLEHIENFEMAIENMVNALNDNGYLVMTFPSAPSDYVHNCYNLQNSSYGKDFPFIAQSFSPEIIKNWISKFELIEIESEFWKFWTEKYWTCGNQIIPPIKTDDSGEYQIRCICLQKKK